MEIWILNKELERILHIDNFESLIWTDRYSEYGDFEIVMSMDSNVRDLCEIGNYAILTESDHQMVINNIEITSDVEEGSKLIVRGYSLEYLLSYRVIWDKITYSGSVHDLIKRLISENFGNPSNSKRGVPNFRFIDSTDESLLSIQTDGVEYYSENLYSVVKDLCVDYNLGLHMRFDVSTGELLFGIFKGVDRSGLDGNNSSVWFSPDFDNLLGSEYEESSRIEANSVMLIAENIMGTESEQPKQREVTTKTANKRKSGNRTIETETVNRKLISTTNHQISRSVSTSESISTDKPEEPTYNSPGDRSYEVRDYSKSTNTNTEYNSADTQISTKTSITETNTVERIWVRTISRNGSFETSKLRSEETKTETQTETEDSLDKKTSSVVRTTTVTNKDSDNFVTSETTTVEYISEDTQDKIREWHRIYDGDYTGLDRKELFVDATNTDLTGVDSRPHKVTEYEKILAKRAENELRRVSRSSTYTGETNPNVMYVYQQDYNLGDIVRVSNQFGMVGKSQVSEIIFSQDSSKVTILPTFVSVTELS